MAVTRIKNNQVTDSSAGNIYLGINASTKVQDFSVTAGKLANNLTYGSDLTVAGNLTVQGQTTTIDTVSTVIEDPIIVLASNQTGSPTVDIGFIGERGTSNNIAFVWDESSTEFVTAFTTDLITNTTVTISSYANFHTNDANIGGNLAVSGNVSFTGNITSLNVTGNITGGNLLTPGVVTATGNVTGGNVSAGSGTIVTTGNINGANVNATSGITAGTTVIATGNVSGGNLTTTGITSTGSLSATTTVTATGNITGGNVSAGSGIISTTGNIDGGNVNATANITGTGAVFSGNVTAQNFIGNISGNIDAGGANTNIQFNDSNILAGSAAFTFDKTSNAVAASGNITGGNILTGGQLISTQPGNATTGAGQIFLNGATNNRIDWAAVGTGAPAFTTRSNGTKVVLYPALSASTVDYALGVDSATMWYSVPENADSFKFKWYGATTEVANLSGTGVFSVTGNITGANILTGGSVTATGNITGGNLTTTGITSTGSLTATTTVTATGNITGGNVSAGSGIISTTGNINGGNVNATSGITAGTTIAATGNITGGNLTTTGITSTGSLTATTTIAATGNITGGNLTTTGITSTGSLTATTTVTATGNITGGNLITTGVAQTGSLETTGNALIGGNLIVQGNITYINISDLRVEDPVIILGTGPNGAPLVVNDGLDRGIYMEYFITAGNVAANAFMGYDNSTGNMFIANDVFFTANDIVGVNSYGTLQAGNLYIQSAVSTGNVNAGNLTTGGQVTATGNITGGNLITGGTFQSASITSTGNITGANLNANLGVTATTVTATGNVTGGNVSAGSGIISTTGNIDGGNVNVTSGITAGTTIVATGNITGGNLTTTGITSTGSLTATTTIAATGNITGGNVSAGSGIISTTGNINGGNVNATGNITGGNLTTTGITSTGSLTATTTIAATGNITGGNVSAGSGIISTTGNINGGNVNATANITGTGAVFSGNVTAANFIGNISGNIDAGGANTNIQFNDNEVLAGSAAFTFDKTSNAVAASGNVSVGNLTTAGQVTATGNVSGGNLVTGGIASVTGNITGGNIGTAGQVTATGNITGGNILTSGAGGSIIGTGNISGGNIATTGQLQGGNIVISGDNITDTNGRVNFNTAGGDVDFAVNGDTVANVFYVDAGTGTASFGSATQTTNSVVAFNATNSVLMPVGNTAQRPTGVTGQLRFNSTVNSLEIYDNSAWTSVGQPSFTVITDEQFNGDGSNVVFTLNATATTAGSIVSINGVQQIPTIAYSVSGTTLTFTEAPEPGDLIDVRVLTTTTTVFGISNSTDTAAVSVQDGIGNVDITGNIMPTANATANIGSATLSYNTIFAQATSALYADLAEKYTADAEYAPGTVVVFGGEKEVTVTSVDADRAVAGVVSTNPSYIMNAGLEAEHVAIVALTGRVPCRVTGTVRKGDLMVSAGYGLARAEADPHVGTVIGKALENHEGAESVIEVVVGRF
jgi:hypothetical protein